MPLRGLATPRDCPRLLGSQVEYLGSDGFLSPKLIATYSDQEGREKRVQYAFTKRGLKDYQQMFTGIPANLIPSAETLKHKVVLDAGTGQGTFVNDLRAQGVNRVFGIDIHLTLEQLRQPDVFFKEDMRSTSFANETFDVIYSAWSIFHIQYEASNEAFLIEVLRELKRVLKAGGQIVIYADQNPDVFKAAVAKVGGLTLQMFAGGEDGATTILSKP